MRACRYLHIRRCEQVAAEACLISVSIALYVLYQDLEPGCGENGKVEGLEG